MTAAPLAGRGAATAPKRKARGPAATPAPRVQALPPPTVEDRALARLAAAALRMAIEDSSTMGTAAVVHVDLCRPRRGEWITTWPGLPGFVRAHGSAGRRYTHALLPGWEYRRAEIVAEMIPDLDALAERGERPGVATRR